MIHECYSELPDVSHLSALEIEQKLNQPPSLREKFNDVVFGISCIAFPVSSLATWAASAHSLTAGVIAGTIAGTCMAAGLVTGSNLSKSEDMKEALSIQNKKNKANKCAL